MILLLVCLGVFALLLLAVVSFGGGRSKVVRRISYKVDPLPPRYNPTSTQTRKEAAKTTTLNSYAQQTAPRKSDDNADDGIATAMAAAVILDTSSSSLPAPNSDSDFTKGSGGEFGGGGASGSWDNDCSTSHSSDSYSGGYDSGGGGYDSGGGGCDGGGGGSD